MTAQIILDLKYFSNLYLKVLKVHHLSCQLYSCRQSRTLQKIICSRTFQTVVARSTICMLSGSIELNSVFHAVKVTKLSAHEALELKY